MRKIELKVGSPAVPGRVDAYLTKALLGEYSRQEIKAFLIKGAISLNGKAARPSQVVREGDRICGDLAESEKARPLVPEKIALKVIYEDESLLVIEKPAGMVVHPGAGNKTGTLVHALLGMNKPLSTLGGAFRPGIVHRLDKDTSGLMLVAKTNRAHRALQDQFASRSLSKTYWALVEGDVEFEQGHVSEPVGRDPRVRRKMAVVRNPSARQARTLYRVLKRFRRQTFLEIKILTGRTHQIRVHMAHLGHPVVGDAVYGGKDALIGRPALHACTIEFLHPLTGKKMKFKSQLPPDIRERLRRAENDASPKNC